MTKQEILQQEIKKAESDIKFYNEKIQETEYNHKLEIEKIKEELKKIKDKYNEDQEWNREHLEKAKILLEILKNN